jgi:D-alanyl-D-alanine carboxypeptidase/D-alanyl-D-alanine-endopeptidase (penicillin-binding protein 4)
MRKFFTSLGVAAALGWFVLAADAASAGLQQDLKATLSKLPHAQTRVGACVIDLANGQAVFTLNADAPMTPASTMKLFAMSAALAELGTNFQFETVLATDGTNLLLIGDGDPGFGDDKLHRARGESMYAPFEAWAETLRVRGIMHVRGDIIIDEWVFDDERIHPSWESGDLGKWYSAPVGGLNINDNCLDIAVIPGKAGGPASVSIEPQNGLTTIINKCKTGGKGEPTLNHRAGSNEYTVSGRVTKRWPFSPVACTDPGLLFADSFRSVLARKGIRVEGGIRRGRVRAVDGSLPPPITVLGVHRTPLPEVLARAGKDSQNLFAECLLKRAGFARARRAGQSDARGSWKSGGEAVFALLHRAGIDTHGLAVADGSGLSRDNACTASQLAELLAYEYSQPTGRILKESLATAGVDGSLRKRLKNSDSRVHAKTGTMKGIRALAGYVDGESGPRYAFAVMFNGYKGSSAPYKDIQDRFCRVLADACDSETRGTK